MKIEDGKIVSATEKELYSEYLKKWYYFIPFNEYTRRMKDIGVEIKENDNE